MDREEGPSVTPSPPRPAPPHAAARISLRSGAPPRPSLFFFLFILLSAVLDWTQFKFLMLLTIGLLASLRTPSPQRGLHKHRNFSTDVHGLHIAARAPTLASRTEARTYTPPTIPTTGPAVISLHFRHDARHARANKPWWRPFSSGPMLRLLRIPVGLVRDAIRTAQLAYCTRAVVRGQIALIEFCLERLVLDPHGLRM